MVQLVGDDALARRICDSLKGQVHDGTYRPGDRLPSTRALAAELGVSRGTVTAAYEQLQAEGYLETRRGARARVAPGLRRDPPPSRPRDAPPAAGLSRYGRRVADLPTPPTPPAGRLAVDFRYGDLAAADFPVLAWKRAVDAAILRRPEKLSYGDPQGSPALRTALTGYLWRARGLRCDADSIVVVGGSQQGLDLCARVLVDPGDRVVIEDPCYPMARHVFAAAGATLVPVTADADGLRTQRLEGIDAVRLAFVTPSHQFPLGGVLPVGRRQALLAWARRTGAWILEDDYDGEYRYDAGPIPALHALGEDDRVVYAGTVSKTLSPLLRLGYLVVPPALREVFAMAKRLSDRHAPALEQEALAALVAGGAYERHVRRARRRNAERRAALLAALDATLGTGVVVEGSAAGLHVVAWLRDLPADREADLVAAARAAGVGVYGVAPFYHPEGPAPAQAGLVMGYAALEPDAIDRGVARLAAVVEDIARRA